MTSVDAASFSISDLRQRPEFFNIVADRIWRAWWKDSGHPLEYITGRLSENLDARPVPAALVAHDGPAFLGTSSVIASELEERPHYTPSVAAVWVEPQYRSRGIGAALVERATREGFASGAHRLYLCARPARTEFYRRLGWVPLERGVGKLGLTVFTRDADPSGISSPP
jgi:GNAT superfamily N-acetyltransferase